LDDPLSRIDPNKKVQDKDTEDLSLTEELFKERLLNRKQRLSHIKLLEFQQMQDKDDTREEENDTRKPPPPGKSESPRLSTSERRRKQKLLLKKKAATKKQAAIAASAMALVKLSKASAEGNKSEEPSDTESENVEDIVNSKATRRSAKIEAMERLVEEKKGLTLQKRWKCYVLLKHR
jgi:hypothetical protein